MEYAILAGMIALLGKELIVAYGRRKNNPHNPNGKQFLLLQHIAEVVDEMKELLIRIDERDKAEK